MTAIIDYGAGNLQSVEKALRHIGCEGTVVGGAAGLMSADSAVLPGVGAFGEAMAGLESRGLVGAIGDFVRTGRPFLGICLGLQVLFESSQESPGVKGLSLLPGRIVRLPEDRGLKVPHMGWNSLEVKRPGWLLKGLPAEPYVYFVHSYYLQTEPELVSATAEYGAAIHAAVQKGNIAACQFHPEKSGGVGLAILRNFAGYVKECT
ncbi:imidazole glycerol phosphate synthase subunit HisH [Acutalibacter muris]|jgi:glutamine amidotransferase|uniref:Imidazole glycerol phosphate synthase subunit HisH n=1 Tax=Acutalibacter muris TaxID=1796620 RepID=A0A1Z2XMQ9_9FIRM|nr:imidazole glycerol phosphate synthase subunit HisH [Acutalibacter muris]ANU53605.1 imidazole glycerol phosphate synthase subunit HisH [Hungateiclostridiaceae bacterium KB18]ASB39720.1 imidazole glycerol phosphate synthase subunit HisH [Acutalibacter muris]MCI9193649.1 imidazole glycerol phosphate synthase subunit HisH [Acutalibacter muris]MCI9544597.1 imidazole glycerol phosphate synthase subunit HisH [Acutalibacter muris]QQR29013.1 imidazole glycerol phosphate synthase subunit HisH [Acutal